MDTGRNIDWEVAKLEGSPLVDGMRSTSDSLIQVCEPHVAAQTPPPPRPPRVGWEPVIAGALAAGVLLGAVAAMAMPRLHRSPARVAQVAAAGVAASPPADRAPVRSESEAALRADPALAAPSLVDTPAVPVEPVATATPGASLLSPQPAGAPAWQAAPTGMRLPALPAFHAPEDKLAPLAALPTGLSAPDRAVVFAAGSRRAAACAEPGADRVSVPVSVTFAPAGNVISAAIDGGPYAGTATGRCVTRALRGSSVRAFDGGPITVHGTIRM